MKNIDEKKLAEREEKLLAKIKEIEDKEKELRKKQKELKDKEKAKKQVLLRLAPSLWEDLARWAEEDLRSINSQIEFLLREAVKQKFKK